jgi:hypothetical protein
MWFRVFWGVRCGKVVGENKDSSERNLASSGRYLGRIEGYFESEMGDL